jgi:molybdopterin-containing oxidoreductase family membrane subunit
MSSALAHPDTRARVEAGPVLRGTTGDAEITAKILAPLRTPWRYWLLPLGLCALLTLWLLVSIVYTITVGIGSWGNNIPVAWAFGITNFVWWIGIGHAGTFISAFLLLLQQPWRASINRLAEAMTLFAVMMAGLFPLMHLGRPWFFYWLIPYPSTLGLWPQFKSALPWDVAAITAYFTVSLLFWYTGLIPDLASVRDTAHTLRRRRVYGVFALGWSGSARDWYRHRIAYGLMGALATPLVISVHSIVSSDFAIANLPGWHSTIFPPFFVAGALYSGFAMVLTLMIPFRSVFCLKDVITEVHLDKLSKVTLGMGWIMIFSYVVEFFTAWYTGSTFERYAMLEARPFGPMGAAFWVMIVCNCVTPQALWWRAARVNSVALFGVSLLIQLGMWMERFVIVVGSLTRDFLPSSWGSYAPTWVDWGLLLGTIGCFGLLFLLFLRFIPAVPIAEVKHLRDSLEEQS